MRLVISTFFKPVLSENWFINEIDILNKAKIDYCYIYHSKANAGTSLRQNRIHKHKNKFIFISYFPSRFAKLFKYLFYYHLKVFFKFPIRYIITLFFASRQFDYVFLRNFFKLAKILPRLSVFQPDFLYSHFVGDEYVYCYLLSKFLDKKFGLILHSTYKYPKYSSFLHSKSSFILVKSHYIKSHLLNLYPNIDKDKISIIPWGIDINFFRPPKSKKKILKNIFTIVSVSRFVEKKGLKYLIEASRLLKSQKFTFNIILIGFGKDKRNLLYLISKHGLQNYIHIHNELPHTKRLLRIFQSSDLFVLPAIIDTHGEFDFIPNALLEAMAMEVPVITTRVTGMQEVAMDGDSIIFCKERDPEDLADKIKIVMNLSEEKRKEIGRKGREIVVKYYDKGKQGKKFIDFLNSIVQ